jgi:hypothetical protein
VSTQLPISPDPSVRFPFRIKYRFAANKQIQSAMQMWCVRYYMNGVHAYQEVTKWAAKNSYEVRDIVMLNRTEAEAEGVPHCVRAFA